MKFPKTLFVKIEKEFDGTEYIAADADTFSLVEMGKKTKIATYQLVETNITEGVAKISNRRKV